MPVDPALFDLMHGVMPNKMGGGSSLKGAIKKDPFDAAIEKAIKQEVDTMLADEDPSQNRFISLQAKRSKLEQEVRESLDMSAFGNHIESAIGILKKEGWQSLEKEEFELLVKELDNLSQKLANLKPDSLNNENLTAALTIEQSNLNSILKVGIAKINEGLMSESLSIFTFLSTLDAADPEYWYRLGLVAQKCEQYPLALRAFAAASLLAPDFIGSRVFAAESHLALNQRENALAEIEEAKKLLKTIPNNEEWTKRVADIDTLIEANLIKEG
jgi:tetratricopeptide (TPR) repeat protein